MVRSGSESETASPSWDTTLLSLPPNSFFRKLATLTLHIEKMSAVVLIQNFSDLQIRHREFRLRSISRSNFCRTGHAYLRRRTFENVSEDARPQQLSSII